MAESIARKRASVSAHMVHLRCAYPTTKHAVPWEEILSEWEPKLVDYPSEVVTRAFQAVLDVRRRPGAAYFPSLPEMVVLCDEELDRYARDQADTMRGRLLPPAPNSRAEALRDFYAACEKALRESLGEQFSEANAPIVEGVLLCMCPVFGVSPLVASGREPDRHGAMFNYARAMVAIWRDKKLGPHAVVHGLKRAPDTFGKFPTAGLLTDLIRDKLADESIPVEYRKHQPPAEPEGAT